METLTDTFLLHRRELYGFLVSRTDSAEAAQDCLQDTWLKLQTCSADCHNKRAYVFRVAANTAADWHRSGTREQDFIQRYSNDLRLSSEPDTLHIASLRQTLSRLQRVIATQPRRCINVFLLYHQHGLSQHEVARHLNISVSAVEKHMMRMHKACREVLCNSDHA